MFSTVTGGEAAIAAAHELLARKRRGDSRVAELGVDQVREQLSLAVDRVMSEGSLHDPTLAALAIKQAQGDLGEAICLLRAFRTTLERFGETEAVDTPSMRIRRRIATTHKSVPGGQLLGPTYDYTHRLLDFALMAENEDLPPDPAVAVAEVVPATLGALEGNALLEAALAAADDAEPGDITRDTITFPSRRDVRLQNLARGEEGFLQGLAYSTMRGFGRNHPFIADLRHGEVEVELQVPELGFPVCVGEITLTECQTVHRYPGDAARPPQLTRGYGLSFGQCERRAIAMALLDRAMRANEFNEEAEFPAQDEEFVLAHSDGVEASGLIQHLKLPHYVDFQAVQQLLEKLRASWPPRPQEFPDDSE
ncbi:alpha-D-ribose 1-methylphosphonate 5-triphosphate synthase subunit PhnI [Angulomicrobium tetraedrale]|uniref:Alpha-D-ribose 1-methylphosphonate 5-triphosphate synthase subunit PhnI n=1 Tax=Ancylobacter tetraedralis TaxID=217068 RepID=A0A839Z1G4_9HYPH|nr:carbon-phosphorus lyase complex subunit PhnI [Ancylobacter tetraedralis]MBB3769439.1 alpha-D-ribose 1-methylphosphonate 5-triphosphate synthase subunit PhnI [Ancylobacter tetraedralis]